MKWADEARRLGVRANADTPARAPSTRVAFGAEGIGLCRTEHMFFDEERILADARDDPAPRRGRAAATALAKLLPLQRADFERLFRDHGRAAGHDPPARSAAARVPAARRGARARERRRRSSACRPRRAAPASRSCTSSTRCSASAAAASASRYPEITEMQARAIFEAAVEVERKTGTPVVPEVMIPLVGDRDGVRRMRAQRRSAVAEPRCSSETRRQVRLPDRHHDRAAARGADAPTRSPPATPSSSRSAPTI